jgi:hypothetical protein
VTRPRVEVRVDELVLHGLARCDVRGVEHAVERELTRLLGGGAPARIDVGTFELGREPAAQAIGTRVAAKVHGSLTR